MNENIGDSKRLAKNTILLYFRMLFTMLVGLYTSRVVLYALGVENYGIYNVVGGVVAMFTVLSGSLSASIVRFITFEIGKGDKDKLQRVFSTSVNIQFILIFCVLLAMESVGLWFVNEKMVIPGDRLTAANWVFQFSIVTFAVNLWSVPYNAAIIAHEKMSAFAYISIIEVLCKLGIAFLIQYNPFDKLIYYGLLIMLVGLLIRFLYGSYCKRNFEETRYTPTIDKSLLKDMFGFAGWNFIGASAGVCRTQGVNILINLFYGATVNAARGISVQVNSAVSGFANNFMTALNPQITKSYAAKEYDYMNKLIFKGTKLSFFLLMLISVPILIETDTLLSLWLKEVPQYAVGFVRYMLVFAMCEALSGPLITAMLATGDIKKYQIIVGGTNLLNIPISYLLLKSLDFSTFPEVTMVVAIFLSVVCLVERLIIMRSMINLDSIGFIKSVILPVIIVTILSVLPPLLFHTYFVNNTITSIASMALTVVTSSLCVLFIGLNGGERRVLISKITSYIKRPKRNG